MGRPSRMVASLTATVKPRVSREFASDIFEPSKPLSPEEELEQRRSELRNGLTDMQRLLLFGKLSGLNDKDAAIAAGYSVSVGGARTASALVRPFAAVRVEIGVVADNTVDIGDDAGRAQGIFREEKDPSAITCCFFLPLKTLILKQRIVITSVKNRAFEWTFYAQFLAPSSSGVR